MADLKPVTFDPGVLAPVFFDPVIFDPAPADPVPADPVPACAEPASAEPGRPNEGRCGASLRAPALPGAIRAAGLRSPPCDAAPRAGFRRLRTRATSIGRAPDLLPEPAAPDAPPRPGFLSDVIRPARRLHCRRRDPNPSNFSTLPYRQSPPVWMNSYQRASVPHRDRPPSQPARAVPARLLCAVPGALAPAQR